jgi:hypothetical protein
MKKINMKKILLCLFISLSCLKSFGAVNVTYFEVNNQFLMNGKIKVWNTGTSGFIAHVALSRGYVSGSLETVQAQVRLVVSYGGTHYDISKDYSGNSTILTFTTSDFNSNSIFSVTKDIQGEIPADYRNGTVILQFRVYSNGAWGSWTSVSPEYQTIVATFYEIISPYPNSTAFYRLYKNRHFYTASWSEVQSLTSWTKEGYIGFVKSTQETGTVPLYRYYTPHNDNHYYSTSSSTPSGYNSEGIAGYVYTSSGTNIYPVYQYFSGNGKHFYTSDYSELGAGNGSYNYEGIKFYILK